ncbi:MAG: DUF5011 domain-containing protein [Candidatus Nomurabacteria bacterium]|nr:DUF5011 domain-containing protein [Candidatus Nomurabacteria bacterium]
MFGKIFAFFSDSIRGEVKSTTWVSSSINADFNCIQNVQEWTAPYTGKYKLEVWGAAGGNNLTADTGGKGGYATGEIQLTVGAKLWINVGCRGQTATGSNYSDGGWNGGGQGGKYNSTANPTGGGGGATDIRVANITDGLPSLKTRIIVAGGGGGSGANHGGSTTQDRGGSGGGANGVNGYVSSAYFGYGGTQTAGGDTGSDSRRDSVNAPGTFGQGGSMLAGKQSGKTTGGGGGGGWYGGGAGVWEGGGGGSGYVWTAATSGNYPSGGLYDTLYNSYYLSNTQQLAGNNSMPDPTGGTMTGRGGDGFARITMRAQPPTITLNGSDPLTIAEGTAFTDPGATADDIFDGDLTGNIVVTTGGLDVSVPGTYTVTYSITNSAGLTATVTRTVVVTPNAAVGFVCTQAVQQWTVPTSGLYEIETWGAQGGSGGWFSSAGNYSTGGKGGYATGKVMLAAGTQLYIHVGCQGEGWNPRDQYISNSALKRGGFGGGGNAINNSYSTTGGGGASDVRIGADSLFHRVIVAGGGGGGGNAGSINQLSDGGPGGGEIATTLNVSTQFSGRVPGGGANQNAGGASGGGVVGTFGQGADQTQNLAGAGGGGWYGGGSGNNSTGGGGGSGYALTNSSYKPSGYALGGNHNMTDATLVGGDTLMPAPTGGTQIGQTGDGRVRIKHLASVVAPTLTLSGDNPYSVVQGTSYTDPGVTADDTVDGDISANVIVSTVGLDMNTMGDYTVTYTVTNSLGATTTATRTVRVVPAQDHQFTCVNAVQSWTVPTGGVYKIETWGASGGAVSNTTFNSKGGYAGGEVQLTAGTVLYVHVGCKGEESFGASYINAGGFNGGGSAKNAGNSTVLSVRTGGGGASDVRVLADSLYNRIIVAGGGGGSSGHTANTRAGDGGGNVGGNGIGAGGTQTAGGSSQITLASSVSSGFGVGSSATSSTVGGGGGGWYGGGNGNGAGGGSGYVLTNGSIKPSGYFSQNADYHFGSPVTAAPSDVGYVVNPVLDGHGYARIILVRVI